MGDAEELRRRAEEIKAGQGLVFNLYSQNKAMKGTRESVLAVMVSAGPGKTGKDEAARILRADEETIRGRMRRLEKDGWLTRVGRANWTYSQDATTDIGLLLAAVDQGDEETAAALAATVGPPLPDIEDVWLDEITKGDTPRQELVKIADQVLASAGDKWPNNPAWAAAADRLYGEVLTGV